MSWGKGIIVAMSAFMIFILYMVVTLMSKNTDLESEDYYKKEIAFEQEIQSIKNMNELKDSVHITKNDQFVTIQLPNLADLSDVKIALMRPNNDKDDKTFGLEDTKLLMIPIKELKKGLYEMVIEFKSNNKSYLKKQTLSI